MSNYKEIMDRLKLYYGVKTYKEVAKKLAISYDTVKSWGNRDKVVIETLLECMQHEPVSVDWLLRGIGKMHIKSIEAQIQEMNDENNMMLSPEEDGHLRKISEDLNNINYIRELLQYAPKPFIEQLITRLEEFKKLSEL
ncbi:MAG: helix-turn-helix domain-containing protein [Pseudomonadota bacterium]